MLTVIFYLFAAFTLVAAFYAVAAKSMIRAIFAFFAALFGLAALYIFAFADFIALAQIMIYVGGVVVLMLFGVMLSNRKAFNVLADGETSAIQPFPFGMLAAGILSLLLLVALLGLFASIDVGNLAWIQRALQEQTAHAGDDNSANRLGVNFMTRYLLPLETLSVYLLAVLVAAAYLARKKRQAANRCN